VGFPAVGGGSSEAGRSPGSRAGSRPVCKVHGMAAVFVQVAMGLQADGSPGVASKRA